MRNLLLLLICILPNILLSNTYYFDASKGSDSNSGKSVNQPWKSLKKISNLKLLPGDTVLLRSGTVFNEVFELSAEGNFMNPIIITSYGDSTKAIIKAPDHSLFALRIFNSSYIEVSNLEIVNTGSKALAYRTGVKLESVDYGTAKSIVLKGLDIRDVNGSLVKNEGGGSGILIESKGERILSNFDNLLIEECTIKRCQRNAMIWSANWNREKHWFPSTNTIIRNNYIEGVPGDGIVPIGCENTLIEFNKMVKCPEVLPSTEAAAGIWPWSCDNTTIQFNEVSGHNAPWDAQGFDSDYNCRNTVIQYNYSHENAGGFILICNSGESKNQLGNIGTIVQYNLSINDGNRTRPTRIGMFSPSIHIAGPTKETLIYRNIIYAAEKTSPEVHRSILTSDSWGGYADQTKIIENIFLAKELSKFDLQKSTNNSILNNIFIGKFDFQEKIENNNKLDNTLELFGADELKSEFIRTKRIAQNKFVINYVDRQSINDYFAQLINHK